MGESVGLLLNRIEFDQIVVQDPRNLKLHPGLLDNIFNWTVGHVGAVVQLLNIISQQVSL